ncbi:MAG: porin [Nitrospirae bacterium]|nr:porin [Nitrospirota bacterium]
MTLDRRFARWSRIALASAFLMGAQEIIGTTTGIAFADSGTPAASAPASSGTTASPAPAPAGAPAAAPAPPSDLVVPAMNIHLKGFVDVYAQYNPTSAGTTDFRAYDYGANSFNVNMAQLKLWRPDDDGVGFVLRTDFGPGAYASAQNFSPGYYGALGGGHAFGSNGTTLEAPNAAGMPYSSFWMEEAYINFLVPDTNKELEVYTGQFQTLANFEVIQPYGNWMISDGYTFFLGPYTQTGVRVHYAPNATTNFYLGVNNGWNSNFQSNEGSYFQDLELGLVANPVSWLNINFSGYLGPQVRNMYFDPLFFGAISPAAQAQYTNGNANTPTWRNYGAFVVEVGPFAHFTLVTDDSYGWQAEGQISSTTGMPVGNATWYSSENFVRYDISDTMDLVARYEVYYDPNGFMTGIPGTAINDETVDFQWNFYPNIISRIEYRHDNSNNALFNNSLYSSANRGPALYSQDTVDLELIYTF